MDAEVYLLTYSRTTIEWKQFKDGMFNPHSSLIVANMNQAGQGGKDL